MKKLTTDIMLELHVPDFNLVKSFYADFGFEVVWERKPQDKKGYLVMRKGSSILNFYCGNENVYQQDYFRKFSRTTPRGYGVEIVLPCDNISATYQAVIKKRPECIVGKLQKKHSHFDFRIIDPFGYYLRFVERYDWVNKRDKVGNLL